MAKLVVTVEGEPTKNEDGSVTVHGGTTTIANVSEPGSPAQPIPPIPTHPTAPPGPSPHKR